ncbi:MAG: hypothetical protein JEZ07_09465 [Phycisphaerae bacterium]|nr:hypothetical protein [Phycisphaerae bacterium]
MKGWQGVHLADGLVATVIMDSDKTILADFWITIEIDSLESLAKIGNDPNYPLDEHYILTANIDAWQTANWNDEESDEEILEGFEPIGVYTESAINPFNGIFDGQNHIITGLNIHRPDRDYVGLFSCIGTDGIVKNLGLVDTAITGNYCAGSVVGINGGVVSHCYADGFVGAAIYPAGLVGENYGFISNTFATGTAKATNYGAAGFVGINNASIATSYSTTKVIGNGGGFIGSQSSSATVIDCYWDVYLSGKNNSAGGAGRYIGQMLQQTNYPNWDFENTWEILENRSYPYIKDMVPTYKLTVTVDGPGQVIISPESDNGRYAPGTLISLRAISGDVPCVFIEWHDFKENPQTFVYVGTSSEFVAKFAPAIGIDTLATLAKIGNDPSYPLDGTYALMCDIDARETAYWNDEGTDDTILEGFKPIGDYINMFTGSFEGWGHTIKGLTINRPDTNYVGLFGCVHGWPYVVRNLGIVNANITGKAGVGAVAAFNAGSISNCYATGQVAGNWGIGGLVGGNNGGSIYDSYAFSSVSAVTHTAGGLVGLNEAGIYNCYSIGTVIGTEKVGGLVGSNNGGVMGSGWDVETSGLSVSAGGIGVGTGQLQDSAVLIGVGWDFVGETENGEEDIWRMHSGKVSYPRLWYQVDIAGDMAGGDGVDLEDLAELAIGWLDSDGYDMGDLINLAGHWLEGK